MTYGISHIRLVRDVLDVIENQLARGPERAGADPDADEPPTSPVDETKKLGPGDFLYVQAVCDPNSGDGVDSRGAVWLDLHVINFWHEAVVFSAEAVEVESCCDGHAIINAVSPEEPVPDWKDLLIEPNSVHVVHVRLASGHPIADGPAPMRAVACFVRIKANIAHRSGISRLNFHESLWMPYRVVPK
jgi:hypothetical protein